LAGIRYYSYAILDKKGAFGQKMNNRIFIVGGGSSLIGFPWKMLRNEDTIAVNAAIFDVPNANYFITMDHSFLRKIQPMKRSFDSKDVTKVFVGGFHHEYLKERRGLIMDERFRRIYRLEQFDIIVKSYTEEGCGFSFGDFRSGDNSGFCGLQLAVLLRYQKIYLLGMDFAFTGRTHYHNVYRGTRDFDAKLHHYEDNFRKGLSDIKRISDIEVCSCSEISALNDVIPYVPMKEIMWQGVV